MKRFQKTALRLLALAALLVAACGNDDGDTAQSGEGASGGSDDGPVSVTIGYSRAAEQMSLWVAEDQGFFDDHGIDVTLEEVAGAGQVPVAISGGSAEMGFQTGPDFLNAVDQGIDLVVVSGLSVDTADNPRVALIASKASGIEEPSDVEGATVAVPTFNSSSDLSTIHVLREQGVDTDTIEWVEVPFQQMADAISAGRVDAAVAVHPFIGQLEAQGHTVVVEQYATDDQAMLVVFLSADRSWAESNPEAVERIRAALDEANEFIAENPDESRAIVEKYSGLPAEIIERIPFPNLTTEISSGQLDFFVDIMADQGLLDADVDTESLIVG